MMVIQYIEPGRDFPVGLQGNQEFFDQINRTTRKRLELRPEDSIFIVQVVSQS